MAGSSRAYRQFLESLQAPRTDRRYADEFHVGALEQLEGKERERAEQLLLDRLAKDRSDSRIPAALAIVGSSKSIRPLHDALGEAVDTTRLRVAAALARLDPDFDPIAIYLTALSRGDFVTRGLAADLLGDWPRARVKRPLLDALNDPDFAVRVSALDSLLAVYDLTSFKEPAKSPLRTIGMRLLSDLKTVVREAAGEMRDIIAGLEAGRRPEDLGLTEVTTNEAVEAVMASLRSSRKRPPWNEDLDLQALSRLGERGRRYMECVLLSELHEGDPRIPRALAAMKSARAVEPLREALEISKGSMRVQVARALELLARDGRGRAVLKAMADQTEDAKDALKEIGP